MLKHLTIRAKSTLGLIILTILLLITSLISYHTMSSLRSETEIFADALFKAEGVVINADRDLYQALTAQNKYVFINQDAGKRQDIRADYDENVQQAIDRMHAYLDYMKQFPDIAPKLQGFDNDFSSWHAASLKTLDLIDAGQIEEAQKQTRSQNALFKQVREYYNTATEETEALADKINAQNKALAEQSSFLIILIASLSVGIGVLFSIVLPRMIVNSINDINNKVKDIGQGSGDLVSRINIDSGDELGVLGQNMNQFLNKLQNMIQGIKQNSGVLESATVSLNDLSKNSEQLTGTQRQQLETLVTAMTEINHAIRDIASHAQSAASQTENAQKNTENGMRLLERNVINSQQLSQSVEEASRMVAQLADESEKITSVLDVIGSIAEQTNLLALNAAIEAARAGEQGRGFAVVADEVRTLASRTQKSTADIQNMINSLKSGVQNAVQAMNKGSGQMTETLSMIQEASHVLQSVQGQVTEANDMNFQIAAATEQQSTVMESINRSLSELEQATQKQIGYSRQTADSGKHLSELSHHLQQQLNQFRS